MLDRDTLFNIKQITKGNKMNNLKKVGLTALGTALVATSATAADYSISGTSSVTFNGRDNNDTGNGWSMSDGVTFSASGDTAFNNIARVDKDSAAGFIFTV